MIIGFILCLIAFIGCYGTIIEKPSILFIVSTIHHMSYNFLCIEIHLNYLQSCILLVLSLFFNLVSVIVASENENLLTRYVPKRLNKSLHECKETAAWDSLQSEVSAIVIFKSYTNQSIFNSIDILITNCLMQFW